ncbi:MAG TPA: type VI secretion system baseplate subunit TssE [Steroidobacteraceae bacterium]|nr:type VI secretion system baseplate subunit TssE [Steroidobacteraceae bacterium]
MVDLSLNDRLQPALLDRLLDDERTIALITVRVDPAALERVKLPLPALLDILRAQGLSLRSEEQAGETVELKFTASRAHVSPSQLRALILKPAGAPQGVTLQSLATLEATSIPNVELESSERRQLSRAKLRECVLRDLGWLFNSLNLDSTQDLGPFAEVPTSVLNYGLPSFAGRMVSSINPTEAAAELRRTVECFEPRLRNVRVRPLEADEAHTDGTLEFAIEAELWGQPHPQHLQLRTWIDMVSGDIAIAEARGG